MTSFVPSRRARWLGLALVGLVLVGQYWILTAGTWTPNIQDGDGVFTSDYYSLLADAFAHGQLSLRLAPPAELAHLADPYDPAQRAGISILWDAAYYNGKYYLTWGPVPALILVGLRLLTGINGVHDSFLVMLFAAGLTVACAGLLWYLWRWLFPAQLRWVAAIALLALGLGNPLLFMLARPAVYEAAILGGQCFLFWGLLFAFIGLNRPGAGWLLAAGLCWGLAVGSRYSLMPPVAFLTLACTVRLATQRGPAPVRRAAIRAGLFVLPLAILVALLAWFNFARFGNWFETGQAYVLTSVTQHAFVTSHGLLGTSGFFPNLLDYVFRPPKLLGQVPFITTYLSMPAWWPKDLNDLNYEPIVGCLWATPFVMLSAGTIAVAWKQRQPRVGLLPWVASWPLQSDLAWMNLLLISAAGLALLPLLFYRLGVTMRYMADYVPLFILAAGVACAGLQVSRPRRARLLGALAGGLAVLSVCFGVALGFSGYYQHFERHNPGFVEFLRGRVSIACYVTTLLERPLGAQQATNMADACWRAVTPIKIEPANVAIQPNSGYVFLGFNGNVNYGRLQIPAGRLRATLYAWGSVGGGRAPQVQLALQSSEHGPNVAPQTIQLTGDSVSAISVEFDNLPAGDYDPVVLFADNFYEPGQGYRVVILYQVRFQWDR